jgi:hypothetical protein
VAEDPDPSLMDRYCDESVPKMLTVDCDVAEKDATRVAHDIRCRAKAAAHLDQASVEVLASPFFEEAFDHEPTDATPWMKAITTLVIRNSWLEEVHTNGPVKSEGIQAITTHGLGPLSHLIAARRRNPLRSAPSSSPFTNLSDTYPRAWACLTALRDALIGGGGRVGYRAPQQAPIPDLPAPEEIVQAPIAEHIDTPSDEFEAVVFSAIDPPFDHTMLSSLHGAAESEGLLLGLSALSRISRNSDKLLRVLEFLLAHKARYSLPTIC